jgi:NodT family efflux transporter outer membrane factor (OMF) lipoprotein
MDHLHNSYQDLAQSRHRRVALSPLRRFGRSPLRPFLLTAFSLAALSCSVGPNYHRASAPVPAVYKEYKGWKVATPNDAINRGAWWSIYHDGTLDTLENQVNLSNQTIKADEAAYDQAKAIVHEQQSAFFPSLTVTPQVERQKSGGSSGGFNSSAITSYSLEGTATWEPDVWGKIRRTVESSVASAQVSAATLAAAKLSAQATLATDYIELRYEDALKQLFVDTVTAYERSLKITENQYAVGTAARSDVINAQAQLLSAQSSEISVGVLRGQDEHAIALLVGKPPAEVSIPPGTLAERVPIVPTNIPSILLERRPDIAESERQMQEENALIGVQIAAYFPTFDLSAVFGYAGNPGTALFSSSSEVWSLMASASESVLTGGQRSAAVAAARAAYNQSVANYRETVLAAFQNVEDELVALRVLGQQIGVQRDAVAKAQQAVQISLNEYQAGTIPYTTVITAQVTLLQDQETALQVQEQRLVASVALVQALGGGWETSQLPSKQELQKLHLIPD